MLDELSERVIADGEMRVRQENIHARFSFFGSHLLKARHRRKQVLCLAVLFFCYDEPAARIAGLPFSFEVPKEVVDDVRLPWFSLPDMSEKVSHEF